MNNVFVVDIKLSSLIDDNAVCAFSNAVKYLVRQEIFEKKAVITEEEFRKIFMDVLHRMMLLESV